MSDLVKDLRDGLAGTKTLNKAAGTIEQLQQRNAELEESLQTMERQRNAALDDLQRFIEERDELAATVELAKRQLSSPDFPSEIIENVRLALATPAANLNHVKREHFSRGVEYVLEELTAPIPFNIDRVLNQQYPSGKDGE